MTYFLVLVASLALSAHDGHGRKNAPASAQKLKSPLTAAQAKPELAKPSYEQNCASCHGADGRSNSPLASKMTTKPTNLTDNRMDSMKDGEIYWVVTNGIGKAMPALKDKLNDVERWQLVNYVRFLRSRQKGAANHANH